MSSSTKHGDLWPCQCTRYNTSDVLQCPYCFEKKPSVPDDKTVSMIHVDVVKQLLKEAEDCLKCKKEDHGTAALHLFTHLARHLVERRVEFVEREEGVLIRCGTDSVALRHGRQGICGRDGRDCRFSCPVCNPSVANGTQ